MKRLFCTAVIGYLLFITPDLSAAVPKNSSFELWSNGVTSLPDRWTMPQAGCQVVRVASPVQEGTYAAQVTRNGIDCHLAQNLLALSGFSDYSFWAGRTITYGVWVKATCTAPTRVHLSISDGSVSFIEGGETHSVVDHPCDGTWLWMTVTRTMAPDGGQVQLNNSIEGANATAIFDGTAVVFGSSLPAPPVGISSGDKALVVLSVRPDETIPAGSAVYLGTVGFSAQEDHVQFAMPYKTLARNLFVRAGALTGANQGVIFVLRACGQDLPLAVHLEDPDLAAVDTARTVVVNAHCFVSVKIFTSSGYTPSPHRVVVELERAP